MDVLYICNRKKCPNCSDECKHTKDPRYAKNFELEEGKAYNGENYIYAIEKDNASNSVCLIGGKTNE
jgi:hypothetical protein